MHFEALFVSGLFAIAMLFFAYRLGFFVPLQKRPSTLTWKDSLQVFFAFFLFQFLLIPLLAMGWIYKSQGTVVVTTELQGWLNVLSIFLLTALLGFFFWFKKEVFYEFFHSKRPFYDLSMGSLTWFIAFPVVVFFSMVMQVILGDYFGFSLIDQLAVRQLKALFGYPLILGLTIGMVIFFIPILEEILFRGYLQTTLRQRLSPFAAITLCSIIFSIFHFSVSQGMNNINILGALFLLSLFLGYLRERQRNLYPSIALHSTFNAISIGMMLS